MQNIIVINNLMYLFFCSFNQRKGKVRYKKSTNPMDYGCDSHASGVAAATLSLLIRGYVENYSSPTHKVNDYN